MSYVCYHFVYIFQHNYDTELVQQKYTILRASNYSLKANIILSVCYHQCIYSVFSSKILAGAIFVNRYDISLSKKSDFNSMFLTLLYTIHLMSNFDCSSLFDSQHPVHRCTVTNVWGGGGGTTLNIKYIKIL